MNKHPLNPVTREHIETYQRDGVVCLRQMFDREWIERMNRAAQAVIEHPEDWGIQGPSQAEDFTSVIYMWRRPGDFRDFLLESPAAELVGRVLEANEIRAFQDHLFHKPPGSSNVMHWHHDATTWPTVGQQVPTLWVALSRSTADNGQLEFVAGYYQKLLEQNVVFRTSYKTGTFGPVDGVPCPDFDSMRDDPELRFVTFDMEPGDALLFHPRTPHGSKTNRSSTLPRTGLASRWFGDDIRWAPFEGCSGVPGLDEMPPGEPPRGELFPVAWRRSDAEKDVA